MGDPIIVPTETAAADEAAAPGPAPQPASIHAEPLVRIPELCGNCEHWRPHGGVRSFGQCMASMRASPSPLVTTDRGSCTAWTVAKRLVAG